MNVYQIYVLRSAVMIYHKFNQMMKGEIWGCGQRKIMRGLKGPSYQSTKLIW